MTGFRYRQELSVGFHIGNNNAVIRAKTEKGLLFFVFVFLLFSDF